MTRPTNSIFAHSLAAVAAVFIALTSIGTIVTVPEAQAHAVEPVAQIAELA